jgi:hypothetical protein
MEEGGGGGGGGMKKGGEQNEGTERHTKEERKDEGRKTK